MTHLLLLTAFVIWYSFFEASDDAHEIAEHREIDHVAQWLTRAAVFGSAWYLLWVLAAKPSTWPILIGHAFLFSAVFRYRLNKRRGKHWAYIAPWSNVYDRVWYCIVNMTFKPDLKMVKVRYFAPEWIMFPVDAKHGIHRAGRLAYCVELTLFALCTAGAIMQLKG